ncbi:MAG: tetratricopeptide repeat protein [Isosphaeraceae bacterium]
MRIGACPYIKFSASRLLRSIVMAAMLTLAGMALALGSAWIRVIGSPKVLRQHLAVWFLAVVLNSYFWVWLAAVSGLALSGWLVWTRRCQGHQHRGFPRAAQSRAVQWLLLCGSCLCGLSLAEVGAATWLAWLHRLPALPKSFPEPARPAGEVSIVVIGGSSALGVPYEDWLSVGTLVGRALERAIPGRRFRVDVLAELGATLENMHLKLSRLTKKPDALIVYSGHNEFLARFTLANQVFYYDDERSLEHRFATLEHWSRISPFLTLVRENLERQRLRVIPSLSLGALDRAVGRPVCEPATAARIVADFQQRLEAIVSDCERIGCLPVLIIPPGNDAADPTRSYVTPSTRADTRRALALRMETVRALESHDPATAAAEYRHVISEHPGFAHAHYRLARLLESAGTFSEANKHYILARDQDGLPLRCLSVLEAAYHTVAQRHAASVVLVDGPAVLRKRSRHGILDDELFHDLVHPTLTGHVALAQAVLAGLRARDAFDWPEATPAPTLDPNRCAVQSGIDATAWALVCQRSAAQYDMLAFLTVDPHERTEHRDRLRMTANQIRAGVPPHDLTILGLETESALRDRHEMTPETAGKSRPAEDSGP